MLKIGVLVSGGGTNLQAIIDAIKNGKLKAAIVGVVSSDSNAYALKRAENHEIDNITISKNIYKNTDYYEQALIDYFKDKGAELIVMAGFLTIVGNKFIKAFENKIMNIHPSLIPAFCGDGYYGLKVHEKALEKGVKISGATVHFVNDQTDGGPIILQKAVRISL